MGGAFSGNLNFEGMADFQRFCDAMAAPAEAGTRVSGRYWIYWDERSPTGAVTPTVAVGQVRSARVGRERAESKGATVGTRTGSEAGCVG